MRERWRFRSCSGVPSKNKAQGSLMESSQVPDRRPSSRKMLSYVPFYHGSIPKLMGIKIYTKEALSRPLCHSFMLYVVVHFCMASHVSMWWFVWLDLHSSHVLLPVCGGSFCHSFMLYLVTLLGVLSVTIFCLGHFLYMGCASAFILGP